MIKNFDAVCEAQILDLVVKVGNFQLLQILVLLHILIWKNPNSI